MALKRRQRKLNKLNRLWRDLDDTEYQPWMARAEDNLTGKATASLTSQMKQPHLEEDPPWLPPLPGQHYPPTSSGRRRQRNSASESAGSRSRSIEWKSKRARSRSREKERESRRSKSRSPSNGFKKPRPPPEFIELDSDSLESRDEKNSSDEDFHPHDIIEIPVPPRPPPEFIELDTDYPESHENTLEGEAPEDLLCKVMTQYSIDFPRHSTLADKAAIEKKCQDLLLDYKVREGVQDPPFCPIHPKIMTVNYYRHLLRHRTELDSIMIEIRKDMESPTRIITWKARRELNFQIEKYLTPTPGISHLCPDSSVGRTNEGQPLSLDPQRPFAELIPEVKSNKKKALEMLLAEGKTELQSILHPKFSRSLPPSAIPREEIWKAKWNPINLSISFPLFIFHVQEEGPSALGRSGPISEWEETWKKAYIEYMAKVAESNQEFLLSVISAYGVAVKVYPGRILELFQAKGMLKYEFAIEDQRSRGREETVGKDDDDVMPHWNEGVSKALSQKDPEVTPIGISL